MCDVITLLLTYKMFKITVYSFKQKRQTFNAISKFTASSFSMVWGFLVGYQGL